ncbi:PKD domain-containing protein [Teredinibacter turnerae]|uniref:PKD domain-containing protein n=1 Tax=Teredinibacter turnerae TaxID=2426 RepID=UPI000379F541|nr:PKD domain-containing protein [Teredinibacter turnerae]
MSENEVKKNEVETRVEEQKKSIAAISGGLLAIQSGSVILFPTVFSSFAAPYIGDFALYIFWGLSALGFGFNIVAFYLSSFVKLVIPQKSAGIGLWLTLFSIVVLGVFIISNLVEDRIAPPQITAVSSNPKSVEIGNWITLNAQAKDQDNDDLSWQWEFKDQQLNNLLKAKLDRNSFSFRVPSSVKPGVYSATAAVTDSSGRKDSQSTDFSIESKNVPNNIKSSPSTQLKAYTRDRINLNLARMVREKKLSADMVDEVKKPLNEMILKNIRSVKAIEHESESINCAIDAYFDIPLNVLKQKGWRVCCSEYPSIFPFCNSSC